MQTQHLRVFWDGKVWRAEGYILGKRIRKGLGIRAPDKEKLARKAADKIFENEYLAGLARKNTESTPLFATAAINYMTEFGYNRYANYLDKILTIIPAAARIGELNKAVLLQLGSTHLPTYNRQSVMDCFVKPAMTVIRHANGERQYRSQMKAKQARALTVDQVLRLLDAAANSPEVLRWDPDRQTLKKIAFQLGGSASPGETCAVMAQDVDPKHKRIWLAGREPGASKNPWRVRYTYLPDFYWDLLGELPTEGKAFRTPRGDPYTSREFSGGQYSGAFASVVREAGLSSDFKAHDLRHTWASHFYAATQNIKALEKLGGWASHEIPLSTYVELLPASTANELLEASIDYGQVLDRMIQRAA